MYDIRPNLVIGFHGCEANVRDSLLNNPDEIVISKKKYDWLGNGMYFWENNYDRALEWAEDKQQRGEIKVPAVIGAVLHLGICCDLLDTSYIKLIKAYYELMVEDFNKQNKTLLLNKDVASDPHKDRLLRGIRLCHH